VGTVKEMFDKTYDPAEFSDEIKMNPMFNIGFVNDKSCEDETQFTVVGNHTVSGCKNDLDELFTGFCSENGFDSEKVLYITYVGPDPYYETEK